MLTKLRVRVYEFLANKERFRRMAMKKEFKAFMMADPDDKAIEAATLSPTWFSALLARGEQYFLKGGGYAGFDKLTYPDSNTSYGNLWVAQHKPGSVDVKLVPSYVPLAITKIEIKGDCVVLSNRGIGGGPDLIRMSATAARRCVETPLEGGGTSFEMEYPLYRKVVIGIDDTDSAAKGATFATGLRIASILDKAVKDVKFLRMTISLNWPNNPHKTTNNASSAFVFAVKPGKEEELISQFVKLAHKYTISEDTGVAVMNRVRIPEQLEAYARKVKSVMVDVSETYEVAKEVGLRLIPITGERGLIGAASAIGLVDHAEEAMTPVKNG